MNHSKSFERELDDLFKIYTDKLRRDVGKKSRGPSTKLDRKKIERKIDFLVEIARQYTLKDVGKKTFEKSFRGKRQWHVKRGKGWGVDNKRRNFRRWYDKEIHGRPSVYVFWNRRACLYVGRTGAGGRRPEAHFERFWFRKVTRIDIYVLNGKRHLPMAECLAIDIYKPKKNKRKSSKQKWRLKCPVCTKEREVRRQLKRLFPPKRGRKK
jgi:hypothetical protein